MTSRGQSLLRDLLLAMISGAAPLENFRPDWLHGMELDFWFPQHQLAFEFQGDQHFAPVFGIDSHRAQAERDAIKRKLCLERGVILIAVEARELEIRKLRNKIKGHIGMKRQDLTLSERRRLYRSITIRGISRQRKRFTAIKRDYVSGLREKYGPLPSLHIHGTRARKAAIKSLWERAINISA